MVPAAALETDEPQSSSSTVYYRYNNLAVANIRIHTEPPDNIRTAIDDIIGARVSTNRLVKLHKIASELHEAYKDLIRGSVYEDDFVNQLHYALKAMNHDNVRFLFKASWRAELKPIVCLSNSHLNILASYNPTSANQERDIDDATASTRHSTANTLGSMLDNRPSQQNTMPPASCDPSEKAEETFPIKTPKPNISIGATMTDLLSALSSAISPRGFCWNPTILSARIRILSA
ncbi:MAG: hypothetical protein M1813_005404 [Trichoglossum hirsutum]|nr:MAG: hypothetical protein M1813_005404 [Trichoglossum hirsutum]